MQCWSHYLKDVVIEKSGGNKVDKSLDQYTLLMNWIKEKEIRFK